MNGDLLEIMSTVLQTKFLFKDGVAKVANPISTLPKIIPGGGEGGLIHGISHSRNRVKQIYV